MNCLHPSLYPLQKSSCLLVSGHDGGLSKSIDFGDPVSDSFIAECASSTPVTKPVSYPPATSDFPNANVGLIANTGATILGNNNSLFIFQSLWETFHRPVL